MADYHAIIARAVSRSPWTTDEARQTIYGRALAALHERLGNDPQISDAELVNEHYKLEVAIYEVEEDLLLSEMRRFVREETALSPPSLIISNIKKFARSVGDKFVRIELQRQSLVPPAIAERSLAGPQTELSAAPSGVPLE
jgi:hypothetical protein